MFQYERINVSKGIHIAKPNESKKYMICHYWYFKDIGYKCVPDVCNINVMIYQWLIIYIYGWYILLD